MARSSLTYVLAEYLLHASDRVPEAAVMNHVRQFYSDLLLRSQREPEVSLSPERERLPEVVSVLRQWVHAGVLEARETPSGIEFAVLHPGDLQETTRLLAN